MENASKALLIVASTLVGIMLISLMVYLFGNFKATATSTEMRFTQEELEAINAKFVNYDTGGNHTIQDEFSITYFRNKRSEVADTINITYRQLFENAPPSLPASPTQAQIDLYNRNLNIYHKELIGASQNLNRVSDVVTCINDAINTNYKNNNAYKSDGLEIQNAIEVIVNLNNYESDFNFAKIKNTSSYFKYLIIEPNRNVKSKYIYGLTSGHTLSTVGTNTQQKRDNANNFSEMFINDKTDGKYNAVSVYDMLEELRDTKVISQDNKTYTVYKYYFIGENFINEETGLIETIKFTLVKDKNF